MGLMMRYADSTVCPDCRCTIPSDPDRCPSCALPLRNSTATELFRTLQHADTLLGRLRKLPIHELAPLSTTTDTAVPPPAPSTSQVRPHVSETRLRGSSVPGVLLGLGALCLLVASVIFLAVAWSWLGVGGRTAVLVALTAATATAGVWWARRGLRVAGESLTTVALGLLTLDLLGAESAGWLGLIADSYFALVVGVSIAVAGLGLAVTSRHRTKPLIAAQLFSALGVLVTYAALRDSFSYDLWISGLAVGIVAAFGLTARGALTHLSWSLAGVAVVLWLDLLLSSLNAVPAQVTFTALWSGTGWALLAAAGYLAAPCLIPALRSTTQWWLGASAVLVTFMIALPADGTSASGLMLVGLVALAAWSGVAWLLPRPWTWSARLPALASALPVSIGLLTLVGTALANLASPAPPYSATIGATLAVADPNLRPWLLLPAALLLAGLTAVIASDLVLVTREYVARGAIAVVALGGLLTLSLFAVPIWAVAATLTAIAIPLVAVAAARVDRWALPLVLCAGPLLAAALVVARPSAGLVALIATALTAVAVQAALTARSTVVEMTGYVVTPIGLTIAMYAAGEVLGLSETYRSIAVILVLGALAIGRPRPDLEIAAAVSATVIGSIAVFGVEGGAGVLALLLTLAGALVTISALLNQDRRLLGWVGGAVLALATWVRLADIGVGTPEAYTLPSALALLAVGGWQLRQNRSAPTAKLLGPGLVLATLPSLLWTLTDPISVRAVVLGVASLALVLGGSALRWNAPVVVGSAVGATLVLIEVAPYTAHTPQWVLIGLAGAILTAVGVTWESRMQDVRQAGAYLERLR